MLQVISFHLVIWLLLMPAFSMAQHKPVYRIYTETGQKTTYRKMLRKIDQSRVILFGEIHNNPIAHWMELEIVKSLETRSTLVIGAEMFETDQQTELNRYLEGDVEKLDSLIDLWPNYDTYYAPVLNYVREQNIPFVATNIPRQYSRLVYRSGFEVLDTLDQDIKKFLPPLPVKFDPELPGYKNIGEMAHGHDTKNLAKAQAIKDATMAHFILENLPEDGIFFHFHGAYHSNNFEGIYWYLRQDRPDLKITTISTVWQDQLDQLHEKNEGLADFIIVVDNDVTRSY